MDADNTYPVDMIPEFITQLITKDLDFITVNRFAKMDKGAMSFAHKIGNKILSITLRLLYSFKIKDSQSGMWLMKRSFVDRIRLNSNNMSMSEEIKIVAFKFFKSLEIDGQYNKRMGTAKLNTILHGWGNFKYLFTFRQLLNCAVVTDLPVEILPQTK
jgi:hypothetical protein